MITAVSLDKGIGTLVACCHVIYVTSRNGIAASRLLYFDLSPPLASTPRQQSLPRHRPLSLKRACSEQDWLKLCINARAHTRQSLSECKDREPRVSLCVSMFSSFIVVVLFLWAQGTAVLVEAQPPQVVVKDTHLM